MLNLGFKVTSVDIFKKNIENLNTCVKKTKTKKHPNARGQYVKFQNRKK